MRELFTVHTPETRSSSNAVLIFGWMQSKPRYLQRYADLFTAMGYAVVTGTAPTQALFFDVDACERFADAGFDLAKEQLQEHGRIVLMPMCNGGLYPTWRWLKTRMAMPSHPDLALLGAMIFDSAPVRPTLDVAGRSIAAGAPRGAKRLVYGACYTVTALHQLPRTLSGTALLKEFWTDMAAWALPCPQLFLLSRDDEITEYAPAARLVAARAAGFIPVDVLLSSSLTSRVMQQTAQASTQRLANSCAVASVVWPSSPHVQHMRTDPVGYTIAVQEWLHALLPAAGPAAVDAADPAEAVTSWTLAVRRQLGAQGRAASANADFVAEMTQSDTFDVADLLPHLEFHDAPRPVGRDSPVPAAVPAAAVVEKQEPADSGEWLDSERLLCSM